MSKKSFIDSVEVGKPCSEDWGKMHGNDRVRFCDHCAKHVNDLSAITRKEAMRLVLASDGNICIRYRVNPVTKRPMFADQLLQITRRAPGLAAGVMSASLSVAGVAYAQEPSPREASPSTSIEKGVERPEKVGSVRSTSSSTSSAIKGVVKDAAGAVVPNVPFSVTNAEGREVAAGATNDLGEFDVSGIEDGTYAVTFRSAQGFMGRTYDNVRAFSGRVAYMSAELNSAVMTGGVMVSVDYSTDLTRAVAMGDIELARDLIIKGENVNGKDKNYNGITPLFVAVELGNIEMATLLLNYGAKAGARDDEKQNVLTRLDEDATPELVELLIRYGAKVNQRDSEGNTALILAARSAHGEVLQRLIDMGADVDAVNNDRETALMSAVSNENVDGVRALMLAGADADLKDSDGDTAFDSCENETIRQLIQSKGLLPVADAPASGPSQDDEDREEPAVDDADTQETSTAAEPPIGVEQTESPQPTP